jgi:nucleotide-binding universal stress UspA family protein
MKILCAIGARGGAVLVHHIVPAATALGAELVLVHVIDLGPRRELEHLPGPLLHRGPRGGHERLHAMDAAETAAGARALAEAQTVAQEAGLAAHARLERGDPGPVIGALARETPADLLVIGARQAPEHHPAAGPASVGRTARFVLDHAPCDVLLLRTLARQ